MDGTPFASKCLSPGCTNSEIIHWAHNNCGGQIENAVDGNQPALKCRACSFYSSLYPDEFDCGWHNKDDSDVNYVPISESDDDYEEADDNIHTRNIMESIKAAREALGPK